MYFKNLKSAFVELKNSKNAHEFILNLDRFGNALCAGFYKTTVSGRVGYFALAKKNPYWLLLQKIIDGTFRPFEGRRHCFRAYKWERNRGLNHRRGSDIALAMLSVIVLLACLVLMPLVWLWALAFPRKV